jgi:predicted phage terminase large subunit-like protein
VKKKSINEYENIELFENEDDWYNYLTDEELKELEALEGIKIRPSYLDWYKKSIPKDWVIPKHIEWLCTEVIQKVIDDPSWNRLILSMPPQHAKSDTITRRLPIYFGEFFEGDNVLITGYSQEFAESSLSLPARNLALERGVLGKSSALKQWSFNNGGSVVVRGVGNPPTGISKLKLIIIDDPCGSREDASSETMQKKIWEWYLGSIVQRFWVDTRVIIIATRWHENDLIGRLIENQPNTWKIINLPAIAEEKDPIGRQEGEALWEELKPLSFLLEQKEQAGDYEFEALFQGHPTPREGSLFKVDKLIPTNTIPPLAKTVRAWDIAHSKGKGDYTAGVKMARCIDGRYIILNSTRDKLDTDERDQLIKDIAKADGVNVKIRVPQDAGAKAWAKSIVRMLAGYSIRAVTVSKNKEDRADPFSSQLNAGNVLILNGTWNKDYIEELRQFPGGKHDDQVDASSDAFEDVAEQQIISGNNISTMEISTNEKVITMGGTVDSQGRVKPPKNAQVFDIYGGLR